MEKIAECTQALVQAIRDSKEYRSFCEVRDRVQAEPGLREQINRFRQHVYEVQNSSEPLDMYGEQLRLARESEEFRKNQLVDEFLRSELRVCRIFQQVTAEILDAVDLDVQEIAEKVGI